MASSRLLRITRELSAAAKYHDHESPWLTHKVLLWAAQFGPFNIPYVAVRRLIISVRSCVLVGDLTAKGRSVGSLSVGDTRDPRCLEVGSPGRQGADGVHTEVGADPPPGFRAPTVVQTPSPPLDGRNLADNGVHRDRVQQQAASNEKR